MVKLQAFKNIIKCKPTLYYSNFLWKQATDLFIALNKS